MTDNINNPAHYQPPGAAVGDPDGRLMLPELVEHCRQLYAKTGGTTCQWTYDEHHDKWDGACGAAWQFDDRRPEDFVYCPKCGREIEEVEP